MSLSMNNPISCARLDRCVVLAALLSTGSCVTRMDSEHYDRMEPVAWSELARSGPVSNSGVLTHSFEELARYQVSGYSGLARCSGSLGMKLVAPGSLGETDFVAGPGDVLALRSTAVLEEGAIVLRRRSGEYLAVVSEGELQLRAEGLDGEWWVSASKPCEAEVRNRKQHVVKKPVAYTWGSERFPSEQLDQEQFFWWVLFPPVEIGRLVSRALGSRLEKPVEYAEEVGDFTEVPLEERLAWDKPVEGVVCRWSLMGPSEDMKIEGELQTGPDGRARVPLEAHAQRIAADIDLGRIGRLEVVHPASGQSSVVAVDLQDILNKGMSR